MTPKEIIYFDELGFGWVVDKSTVQMLQERRIDKEDITEKTLSDLLRRS